MLDVSWESWRKRADGGRSAMEICSMTGFGRAEVVDPDYRLSIELKSVNSRYLDINIKMPRKLNALEGSIRKTVRQYASRGKLDIYITFEDYARKGQTVHVNMALAREYYEAMMRISRELEIVDDVKTSLFSALPEVLELSETGTLDDELLWKRLEEPMKEAFQAFCRSRTEEGANLREDLLQKLEEMDVIVSKISSRAPLILSAYEKRLRDKLSEILDNAAIDAQRITQEAAIYADRICTDEEVVRLRSHIEAMKQKLRGGGPVGRELDFLAQEMNREANTILSKANDLIVSEDAIALKTLIEKIREQIQNIE